MVFGIPTRGRVALKSRDFFYLVRQLCDKNPHRENTLSFNFSRFLRKKIPSKEAKLSESELKKLKNKQKREKAKKEAQKKQGNKESNKKNEPIKEDPLEPEKLLNEAKDNSIEKAKEWSKWLEELR